jgi:hypothetical protein
MNNVELHAQLRALRQSLPHGSSFQYRLSDDSLYLETLQLPAIARAQQPTLLAHIVAAADRAELPVEIHFRASHRQGLTLATLEGLGFETVEEEDEGLFLRRRPNRPDVDWNQVQDVDAVLDAGLEETPARRRRVGLG